MLGRPNPYRKARAKGSIDDLMFDMDKRRHTSFRFQNYQNFITDRPGKLDERYRQKLSWCALDEETGKLDYLTEGGLSPNNGRRMSTSSVGSRGTMGGGDRDSLLPSWDALKSNTTEGGSKSGDGNEDDSASASGKEGQDSGSLSPCVSGRTLIRTPPPSSARDSPSMLGDDGGSGGPRLTPGKPNSGRSWVTPKFAIDAENRTPSTLHEDSPGDDHHHYTPPLPEHSVSVDNIRYGMSRSPSMSRSMSMSPSLSLSPPRNRYNMHQALGASSGTNAPGSGPTSLGVRRSPLSPRRLGTSSARLSGSLPPVRSNDDGNATTPPLAPRRLPAAAVALSPPPMVASTATADVPSKVAIPAVPGGVVDIASSAKKSAEGDGDKGGGSAVVSPPEDGTPMSPPLAFCGDDSSSSSGGGSLGGEIGCPRGSSCGGMGAFPLGVSESGGYRQGVFDSAAGSAGVGSTENISAVTATGPRDSVTAVVAVATTLSATGKSNEMTMMRSGVAAVGNGRSSDRGSCGDGGCGGGGGSGPGLGREASYGTLSQNLFSNTASGVGNMNNFDDEDIENGGRGGNYPRRSEESTYFSSTTSTLIVPEPYPPSRDSLFNNVSSSSRGSGSSGISCPPAFAVGGGGGGGESRPLAAAAAGVEAAVVRGGVPRVGASRGGNSGGAALAVGVTRVDLGKVSRGRVPRVDSEKLEYNKEQNREVAANLEAVAAELGRRKQLLAWEGADGAAAVVALVSGVRAGSEEEPTKASEAKARSGHPVGVTTGGGKGLPRAQELDEGEKSKWRPAQLQSSEDALVLPPPLDIVPVVPTAKSPAAIPLTGSIINGPDCTVADAPTDGAVTAGGTSERKFVTEGSPVSTPRLDPTRAMSAKRKNDKGSGTTGGKGEIGVIAGDATAVGGIGMALGKSSDTGVPAAAAVSSPSPGRTRKGQPTPLGDERDHAKDMDKDKDKDQDNSKGSGSSSGSGGGGGGGSPSREWSPRVGGGQVTAATVAAAAAATMLSASPKRTVPRQTSSSSNTDAATVIAGGARTLGGPGPVAASMMMPPPARGRESPLQVHPPSPVGSSPREVPLASGGRTPRTPDVIAPSSASGFGRTSVTPQRLHHSRQKAAAAAVAAAGGVGNGRGRQINKGMEVRGSSAPPSEGGRSLTQEMDGICADIVTSTDLVSSIQVMAEDTAALCGVPTNIPTPSSPTFDNPTSPRPFFGGGGGDSSSRTVAASPKSPASRGKGTSTRKGKYQVKDSFNRLRGWINGGFASGNSRRNNNNNKSTSPTTPKSSKRGSVGKGRGFSERVIAGGDKASADARRESGAAASTPGAGTPTTTTTTAATTTTSRRGSVGKSTRLRAVPQNPPVRVAGRDSFKGGSAASAARKLGAGGTIGGGTRQRLSPRVTGRTTQGTGGGGGGGGGGAGSPHATRDTSASSSVATLTPTGTTVTTPSLSTPTLANITPSSQGSHEVWMVPTGSPAVQPSPGQYQQHTHACPSPAGWGTSGATTALDGGVTITPRRTIKASASAAATTAFAAAGSRSPTFQPSPRQHQQHTTHACPSPAGWGTSGAASTTLDGCVTVTPRKTIKAPASAAATAAIAAAVSPAAGRMALGGVAAGSVGAAVPSRAKTAKVAKSLGATVPALSAASRVTNRAGQASSGTLGTRVGERSLNGKKKSVRSGGAATGSSSSSSSGTKQQQQRAVEPSSAPMKSPKGQVMGHGRRGVEPSPPPPQSVKLSRKGGSALSLLASPKKW